MIRRPSAGEEDVARVRAFNAAEIADQGMCGHLHPGGIAHRLCNGNRLFEPADELTIWESGSDGVRSCRERRDERGFASALPKRRVQTGVPPRHLHEATAGLVLGTSESGAF